MKKILSIACLLIALCSFKAFSQSNITWVVNDDVHKGFAKTATTINGSFNGFTSQSEANTLFGKIKSVAGVSSVNISGSDAKGNCNAKLVVSEPHKTIYYIDLAQKVGIAYVMVNGEKKTPAEWAAKLREAKAKGK